MMSTAITFFAVFFLTVNVIAQSVTGIRTINSFSPDPESESFSAVYSKWTNKSVDTLALVRVDSLGRISLRATLDPRIIGFSSISIITDSLLLLSWDSGQYGKTTVSTYNVSTHSSQKILDKTLITAVSTDRQYFSCQRDNIASPSTIYRVQNAQSRPLEGIGTPYHIQSAFGKNQFIVFDSTVACTGRSSPAGLFDYGIMRYDGTIIDTIPREARSSIQQGKNEQEIVFLLPIRGGYRNDAVISYNLKSKQFDTLFSGLIFHSVRAIPNTDLYLLNGLSQDERKEMISLQVEQFKKQYRDGVMDDFNEPPGYWMIGDSKSKRIKKLPYKDYWPTVSFSGRHILFSKQESKDYQVKVIPLNKLVE